MYLFFDTETTGLSSLKDHVVQLAWVLTDAVGNIKAEECFVIRPDGYAVPDAAARIHGITTVKACEIGQPLGLVLKRFSDDAARATIIIAHNLSFDLGILKHDYKIARLQFPLHGQTQICTMKLSTTWCRLPKLNGSTGFKWPRLDELHYRLFGENFDGAHDALADTHACRRCYFELVKLGVITPPAIKNNSENFHTGTKPIPLKNIDHFVVNINRNAVDSLADTINRDIVKFKKALAEKEANQPLINVIKQEAITPHKSGLKCTKCRGVFFNCEYCPMCHSKLLCQNPSPSININHKQSRHDKKWLYDSKTKILINNQTGTEYPPSLYEYQRTSTNTSGYQILHGADVWVNDWDVDFK